MLYLLIVETDSRYKMVIKIERWITSL
jgi:hypothetical protein